MLWKDFDNIKRHRYHVILWTVFQTFSSVGLHLPMHLKFRKRYKPTAVHKIWCVCFGGTLKMWIISPTSVSSQQERKIIIHFEILYMYLGCLSRSDVDFTENCSLIEKWSKGRWIWKILILPPTWFHTASFPKRLCFGRDGRREHQEQASHTGEVVVFLFKHLSRMSWQSHPSATLQSAELECALFKFCYANENRAVLKFVHLLISLFTWLLKPFGCFLTQNKFLLSGTPTDVQVLCAASPAYVLWELDASAVWCFS